jgi:hypothetical protein
MGATSPLSCAPEQFVSLLIESGDQSVWPARFHNALELRALHRELTDRAVEVHFGQTLQYQQPASPDKHDRGFKIAARYRKTRKGASIVAPRGLSDLEIGRLALVRSNSESHVEMGRSANPMFLWSYGDWNPR